MADDPTNPPERSARATMIYLVHNGPAATINASMPANLPKEIAGQPVKYFWKDVLLTGQYIHPIQKFHLDVDQKSLARFATVGNDMMVKGIAIPINCDHSDKARDVMGYVKQFRADGARLLALCQAIGSDAALTMARNYVSVGIDPDFVDGKGKDWGEAIVHLALTPVPVVPDQEQFIKAASRLTAAGDVLLLSAAETPTQRSQNMATNLSDGQVGSLRQKKHLCMSGTPDDGIGDQLVRHHEKQERQLSDACDAMGDTACPPDEAMSRLIGHARALKQIQASLLPKHLSLANSKPEEVAAAVANRIAELSRFASERDAMESAKTAAENRVIELSKLVPQNPFNSPEQEQDGIESASIPFDALCSAKNPMPTAIVDRLKCCLVSRDGAKAQKLALSRTGNQGGAMPLAKEIAMILADACETGWAPKAGERTKLQSLSRVAPGETDASRAKDEEAAHKFMSGAAAK
jgi:hypothetical protein